GGDVGFERLPGGFLAVLECFFHFGVEGVEDLFHVGFGAGEDLLDFCGDFGAFGLVLGFGFAFVGDQFGQRGALGAVHAGDAGGGLLGGLRLVLLDDFLLVLAELGGRGVGVGRRGLLVGQGLLELWLVGLGQLLLGDLSFGHFLVGLVFTGLEVGLLGRCGLWDRAGGGDGRGLAGLLLGHGDDGFGDGLGLVGRGFGGGLDVLGLALLAL